MIWTPENGHSVVLVNAWMTTNIEWRHRRSYWLYQYDIGIWYLIPPPYFLARILLYIKNPMHCIPCTCNTCRNAHDLHRMMLMLHVRLLRLQLASAFKALNLTGKLEQTWRWANRTSVRIAVPMSAYMDAITTPSWLPVPVLPDKHLDNGLDPISYSVSSWHNKCYVYFLWFRTQTQYL